MRGLTKMPLDESPTADHVHMRVPDLRHVQALERAAHEVGAVKRQGGAAMAGIPHALLGPEFPRSEARGAG